MTLSRRHFLKLVSLATLTAGVPACAWPRRAGAAAALLDPATVPQFVNALPNPLDPRFVFAPTAGAHYDISAAPVLQDLGLGAGVGPTRVWGYGGAAQAPGLPSVTYPGRTLVAQRGVPITVRWTNALVDEAGEPVSHLLPVDPSVHWADPLGHGPATGAYTGPVPIVTHLHGGHSRSDSDGLPDAWFTPGDVYTGRLFNPLYTYDNDQEAATLWYHDHALGITRLNVYAGLAGFYILRDPWEASLGLPEFPYEVPIVIQDRIFTADGQLHYPAAPEEEDSPDPSVLPEFFGNVILVNGRAWPVLDVEPRKYRLRLLNGSDSRFYNLWIAPGAGGGNPAMVQIGTDSGLLPAPVPLNRLVLAPGERADLIVDFAPFAGLTLVMRNNARSPFPRGETPEPRTEGRIMAFRVGTTVTQPDTPIPASLRPDALVLPGPIARTRRLLLFEGEDAYGRLQPLLGVVDPGGPADGTLLWSDPITERPQLGDVEMWEVFNATEDAHPIHLHLVSFQIVSRQKFTATVTPKENDGGTTGGVLGDVRLLGRPKPPDANEAGRKDTALMLPGEATRIVARFDRRGEYVWHCHILSHEDHEMMRAYEVV